MKKVLYKCRRSMVAVMKLVLYAVLFLLLFGMLSINNPQIRRISRTAAITWLTFFFACVAFASIYGRFDIGVRKSKPIVFSLSLSVIFIDLITFLMMVVMNVNVTTNYSIYPYFWKDVGFICIAFLLQMLWIVLFTYICNGIFFRIVPPERCVIVAGDSVDIRNLLNGIGKYRRQYEITEILPEDAPNLTEAIDAADTVFLHHVPKEMQDKVVLYCYQNLKDVHFTPEIVDMITINTRMNVLDEALLLSAETTEPSTEQLFIKRLADIVLSAVGLIITSPLMLLSALAIRLDDGGSVIFRQNRVTQWGRIFTIYKFRTMVEDAGLKPVTEHDSRITRVGGFLRKYRLDELPQLWNVLKGDMSLVGPRPEMTQYVYVYSENLPEFMYRHRMKAGITGYAQITGRYNTTSKDKLMLDLSYINQFSLWNDIRILFQTALVLLQAQESTAAFSEEDESRIIGQLERARTSAGRNEGEDNTWQL